jgi:hypothetical protein
MGNEERWLPDIKIQTEREKLVKFCMEIDNKHTYKL